jgi:RHS repeat-associated protein
MDLPLGDSHTKGASIGSFDWKRNHPSVVCFLRPIRSRCVVVVEKANLLRKRDAKPRDSLSQPGRRNGAVARARFLSDPLVISCPSTSFCATVDANGRVVTYNGTSWSSASDVDGSNNFKGISCPNSSFCAAVDTTGHVVTYNGTSWASAVDIDGSTTTYGVSCPISLFCVAVDNAGNVLTYNGTSWSSASDVDGAKTLNAISCPSLSFCQAVDSSGNVLSDGAANVTSQLTWDTNGELPLVLSDGTNDYIYGAGTTPVEEVNLSTSTPTYMTYSSSDSSWLTTNAAGDETGFWGYDSFGDLAFGTPDSPFGYAGQYTDASTGLVNDRARFYDSQTGEFTTRDPAFNSTDQAYAYAGNDPINGSDPTGECTALFDFGCQAYMQPLKASVEAAGGSLPVGLSEAGEILQVNHYTLSDTIDYLRSFRAFSSFRYVTPPPLSCPSNLGPHIDVKELHSGQTLYRYTSSNQTYGNGIFISPTLYSRPGNARRHLALPPWNNGSQTWFVQPVRDTLVLDGQVGSNNGQPGGGWQDVVLTISDLSYTYVGSTSSNA